MTTDKASGPPLPTVPERAGRRRSTLRSRTRRGSTITAWRQGQLRRRLRHRRRGAQSGAGDGLRRDSDCGQHPPGRPGDTGTILEQAGELLDFTEPVAITLVAVLHAVAATDDPHAIVARLLNAVPSSSYLAITHLASDLLDQETREGLEDLYGRSMQQRITARSREEVARFFAGTDLVEPGVVRPEEWRPDPGTAETARSSLWSGPAGRDGAAVEVPVPSGPAGESMWSPHARSRHRC